MPNKLEYFFKKNYAEGNQPSDSKLEAKNRVETPFDQL